MGTVVTRIAREVYRREAIPVRLRWWLAAAGMVDWMRALASGLRPHLGERSRPVLAEAFAELVRRRAPLLVRGIPSLPTGDERGAALAVAGLYRLGARPRAAWIFAALGGIPRGPLERLRGARLAGALPVGARWEEVTAHLGELLVVLTDRLPAELPHARKLVGDICFDSGVRFAEDTARRFGLALPVADAPAQAIEILRMTEYVFRVNPEHWSFADGATSRGYLEGNACPWYERPGWNGAHCGIFGQFQAGIASVFGLRYQLGRTIPKHGGSTCRVDLSPLPAERLLRRATDARASRT